MVLFQDVNEILTRPIEDYVLPNTSMAVVVVFWKTVTRVMSRNVLFIRLQRLFKKYNGKWYFALFVRQFFQASENVSKAHNC